MLNTNKIADEMLERIFEVPHLSKEEVDSYFEDIKKGGMAAINARAFLALAHFYLIPNAIYAKAREGLVKSDADVERFTVEGKHSLEKAISAYCGFEKDGDFETFVYDRILLGMA